MERIHREKEFLHDSITQGPQSLEDKEQGGGCLELEGGKMEVMLTGSGEQMEKIKEVLEMVVMAPQ